MPKVLYLSQRELTTVVDALTLYAADPDVGEATPPPTVRNKRSDADRAHAAILAGYAAKVATSDDFEADKLRDAWYSHLRPDLVDPPAEGAPPCEPTSTGYLMWPVDTSRP